MSVFIYDPKFRAAKLVISFDSSKKKQIHGTFFQEGILYLGRMKEKTVPAPSSDFTDIEV